jgi:hypothetical protein
VPEGHTRDTALEPVVRRLNPDIFGPEVSEQEALQKGRGNQRPYQKTLADELKRLACSGGEDARYFVRGLIANYRIVETGAQAPGLVKAILKPDCPVFADLTEEDKAALKDQVALKNLAQRLSSVDLHMLMEKLFGPH